jgi:sulfur-oxidizing protein SoxX
MMEKRTTYFSGAALLSALFVSVGVMAAEPAKEHPGKALAFNPNKGNCLACHGMPTVEDAEQPGNSGPPLIAMPARFPDKAVLRAKIWDASASNPDTFMPLFGKHQALTDKEIDQILDFIYGL